MPQINQMQSCGIAQRSRMYTIIIQYKLTEYFVFLTDICSFEFGDKVVRKWYFKILAYPIWFAVFVLKMLKEGKCHFVFSEAGFERQSNSGSSKLEWTEVGKLVVREHFYILVGNQKGMAPIPKRCLSFPQMQQLEKWARDKLTSEL